VSTLSDILKHPSKHFTSDRKITKDTAFQNILSAGFQSLIYIDDDLILDTTMVIFILSWRGGSTSSVKP
jgi:hypothetical protein